VKICIDLYWLGHL